MIYIYLCPIVDLVSDYDAIISKLPSSIQERIKRKKQQQKRIVSMIGYTLLHRALAEDFAMDFANIHFLDSGKPIFKNQDVYFNISHSNDLVGAVISNRGVVGIDIEQFRKFERVESSFSFFSLVEQEAILKSSNPNRKLIELWSKKEALVKAVGGKMFDMAAQTDVRFSSTFWLNQKYFLNPILYDFDGFIWVASSFSTNNIVIKQQVI